MAAVLVAHCTKVEEQKKKSSVAIERSAGELRGTRLRPSTAVARRRPYVPWGLVLWDNLSITLWGGDSAAPPHSHTWTRQRGRWGSERCLTASCREDGVHELAWIGRARCSSPLCHRNPAANSGVDEPMHSLVRVLCSRVGLCAMCGESRSCWIRRHPPSVRIEKRVSSLDGEETLQAMALDSGRSMERK